MKGYFSISVPRVTVIDRFQINGDHIASTYHKATITTNGIDLSVYSGADHPLSSPSWLYQQGQGREDGSSSREIPQRSACVLYGGRGGRGEVKGEGERGEGERGYTERVRALICRVWFSYRIDTDHI